MSDSKPETVTVEIDPIVTATRLQWDINGKPNDLWQQVVQAVEARGRQRKQVQGKAMSDADFFTGAMAVMEALGLPRTLYPASWTLGIMMGKSPLDKSV